MKMVDMGKKQEKPQGVETAAPPEKENISYPNINLYDNVPDALFKKNVGDTVEIKLVCKICRKSINENSDRKNKDMGLDILKLGVEDKETELKDELSKQLEK